MKKQLLAFIAIFLAAGYISAQTIVDFEDSTAGPLTLHVMGSGVWDDDATHPVDETFMVVDNPDVSGINTSSRVMKFVRRGTVNGGQPWGGFWANADTVVDVTTNKYVHVKVWKSRVSPLKFKLEGGPSGTLEIESKYAQSDANMWVDIVFDFTSMDGVYPVIAFMPDFEDPLTITDDIEIYFDDIRLSNDSIPMMPFSGMIDFENGSVAPLTLHVMGNGDWDNVDLHPIDETFMVVDNPDASGINTSSKVMKFVRRGTDNGGLPWGGFWANSDPKFDITGKQYIHVKVWKSRVSPLKFKLEGGPSGTLEVPSMNTQDDVDKWVDIVFDFTSMDGAYPVIAFMPDFEDPLAITDDIDIYFDDIMVSNDSTPIVVEEFSGLIDFEDGTAAPLTLHVMGNGAWDDDAIHPVEETFMVVDNPDASGINTSSKVMKFVRRGTDNGGLPWGGFWANSDPNFDITGNQYVHVKVWKSRVSPLKFKLEGGPSGTLEIPSMNTQDDVDKWVDIVFDFTSMDGAYPVIAFMPDFEDPLAITEDIDIYFDDIMVSDDPTPITSVFEPRPVVDFSIYPNPASGEVFINVQSDISSISVYNLIGQEVKSIQNLKAGNHNIDISELTEGMYIITVKDNSNRTASTKLFKY